jgi:hypothetical protein
MEEWITRRQLFCGAGWKGLVASATHALREATALQERAEPQREERRDAADSGPSGAASDLGWYFATPLTSYPLLQEMPMDMLLAGRRPGVAVLVLCHGPAGLDKSQIGPSSMGSVHSTGASRGGIGSGSRTGGPEGLLGISNRLCNLCDSGFRTLKGRRSPSSRLPLRGEIPFPELEGKNSVQWLNRERGAVCQAEVRAVGPGVVRASGGEWDGVAASAVGAEPWGGREGTACAPSVERPYRTSAGSRASR